MAKKTKSTFKGRISKNIKRRKQEQSAFGYLVGIPKNVKMLEVKEKTRKMSLDFLPYIVTHEKHPDRVDGAEAGALWFRSPFKVHRDVGVDNETVICPKTVGKPCPICEYMAKLRSEGKDWDDIKPYRPSPRALYVVVPIGLDGIDDDQICIWDVSDFLFFNELQDHLEVNDQDDVFPGLEDGKTANLRLKWKEFGSSKFFETFIVDFEDRDPFDETILEEIPHLDDLLKILTYEEIESKFLDMEDTVSDDDLETPEETEEDDQPKRSHRRKYKQEDPEEPEEETEPKEPEAEKEEEEKPKPRRRTKPKAEEKEEEEAKPVRRTAKKSESGKCPHGHVFGEDFEKFDDCETCDVWDACEEENRTS